MSTAAATLVFASN